VPFSQETDTKKAITGKIEEKKNHGKAYFTMRSQICEEKWHKKCILFEHNQKKRKTKQEKDTSNNILLVNFQQAILQTPVFPVQLP
jgi:hypothetical protein